MAENTSQLNSLWNELKETAKFHLDYAKLTAAEKITVLLATVAFALVAFAMVSSVIFFVSLGLVMLLAKSTGIFGASMIMAGIYVVLLVAAFFLRRVLLINPIARFVSHLLLTND